MNFKTPQSNLLQTQPQETCDNIWTSISRQPLEPPAVSRAGTPGPPGTLVRGGGGRVCAGVGGVSCGASSPVIWTTTAGAHLSVSFRLLLIDDGKYSVLGESLLNATLYDPQKVGVICNKVEDSFSSEKEFSISWQHLPGFMWPMKRGKEGTLPDN